MRLRVVTDKNNRWMQLFNSEGKVKSIRPASAEEVWMFGELDSLMDENNAMQNRIAKAEEAAASLQEDIDRLEADCSRWRAINHELAAKLSEAQQTNDVFRRTIEGMGDNHAF